MNENWNQIKTVAREAVVAAKDYSGAPAEKPGCCPAAKPTCGCRGCDGTCAGGKGRCNCDFLTCMDKDGCNCACPGK